MQRLLKFAGLEDGLSANNSDPISGVAGWAVCPVGPGCDGRQLVAGGCCAPARVGVLTNVSFFDLFKQ
jgi:hypothetical protein